MNESYPIRKGNIEDIPPLTRLDEIKDAVDAGVINPIFIANETGELVARLTPDEKVKLEEFRAQNKEVE